MGLTSKGTCRLRVVAFLVAAVAPMLLLSGCRTGARPVDPGAVSPRSPTPTGSTSRPVAEVKPPPPVVQVPSEIGDQRREQPPAPEGAPPPVESTSSPAVPGTEATVGDATPGPGLPSAGEHGTAVENASKPGPEGAEEPVRKDAPRSPETRPAVVARLPENLSFDRNAPHWARGREELVYRVEFLGITMGYARFVFNGKVLLGGREVYHLSVRAWTSNVLSIIYPINDTIDYYMDTRTFVPLRQEYTSGNRKKEDMTIYDQETGKIVYRYKASGEIRRQVDAVPNIYDPVTLAYFYRTRELGGEEGGRNVYAGRKVWEISATLLGFEKIATETGEVETVVIRPVIKRDGKVEDKGDLRMWMTRDEKRIPVRLYAKFRKIRMWTLVGELMPERKGG